MEYWVNKSEMKSGIYIILNKINQKCYIGSASKLKNRISDHFSMLKTNTHHSKHLQRSYNKYGKDNFIHFVLERVEPKDLISREQYWMDILKPEYNMNPIARNSFGIKRSKETCKKIGLAKLGHSYNKGRIVSQETRDKIAKSLTGKPSPKKGVKASPEVREKMLKALALRTNTTPRLGQSRFGNISQYDLNDVFIKTFDDVYLAAISLGYKRGRGCSILRAITRNGTAFGYKWKLVTKPN